MQPAASSRGEWRATNGERRPAAGPSPSAARRAAALAIVVVALALSACGLTLDDSRAGLSCIDDSSTCVHQREATLKALLADKDHAWVKEEPTPQAHASGVRLFAYVASKAELSCDELAHGRREAESAPKALKGQAGLTPAQVSRAALFADHVQRELSAESRRRRCKA